MKKKVVNHLADTIFWYILYFLPVLLYIIYMFNASVISYVDFGGFIASLGFEFVADNFLITNLTSIFGYNGILPIFSTNTPFIIFSWFIGVYLCHLLVDFLLFIPRLAHKYMNKFTKGD